MVTSLMATDVIPANFRVYRTIPRVIARISILVSPLRATMQRILAAARFPMAQLAQWDRFAKVARAPQPFVATESSKVAKSAMIAI